MNDPAQRAEPGTLRGWHVLAMFVGGFAIIIGVNLTMAFSAVSTFPGLEVQNSYVASQAFDREKAAQDALGWTVEAEVRHGRLVVTVADGDEVAPMQRPTLLLGRATHAADDQTPELRRDGGVWVADTDLTPGRWMLRLEATAPDGTAFRHRLVVEVPA
ncbi:FixH family protein [Jannaschia aquimarina]|uniref:FixH n=1 Tax=Jannaschia aquimarina TaxID=935700 RepID=A0A0D1CMT4_9RHOB|nr:FixH family protein [Jannaschia aquimarina]KIT16107.1 FixH [Jannaschia aquimarina]SNT02565.1 Nitrogen fixation protein FixH [Jannaschia aquimarina]